MILACLEFPNRTYANNGTEISLESILVKACYASHLINVGLAPLLIREITIDQINVVLINLSLLSYREVHSRFGVSVNSLWSLFSQAGFGDKVVSDLPLL